jgi:hypothetical protein
MLHKTKEMRHMQVESGVTMSILTRTVSVSATFLRDICPLKTMRSRLYGSSNGSTASTGCWPSAVTTVDRLWQIRRTVLQFRWRMPKQIV